MPYEIETRDGIVIRGIPDDIPPDHHTIKAKVANARQANATANEGQQVAGEMALQGMSGPQKFLAGTGKAMTDIARGAGQILGMVDQPSIDETKRRDAALMKTGAGMAGNITGGIATGLPSLFVPGANTVVGASIAGGILGGLQPTATGESRLANTTFGSLGGAGGQVAGKLLGRALHPVRSTLSPEASRLASVAASEGIPLDAAATTGSRGLRTINAVMENLPLTGGREAARQGARQAAFNAAVLKRAGIVGDSAEPAILAARKANLGNTFETIAGRNQIDFNQGRVTQELADIWQEAGRRLSNPGPIQNTIDDIMSDAATTGALPGAKYQGWRDTLRKLAKGNDLQANLAGKMKRALDDAFTAQTSGADAQAWKQASREYANLKTILRAQGGPGVLPNEGNISPAQLSQALSNSVTREGKALGRGDLNDLSRAGQMFVRSQVPDSGSAQRLLYQSLLTGGGVTGAYLDPERAPLYLGAAGASLAMPRIAQALMNSGAGQRYLSQGALSVTPQQQAIANALMRSAGAAAPLAYSAQ